MYLHFILGMCGLGNMATKYMIYGAGTSASAGIILTPLTLLMV